MDTARGDQPACVEMQLGMKAGLAMHRGACLSYVALLGRCCSCEMREGTNEAVNGLAWCISCSVPRRGEIMSAQKAVHDQSHVEGETWSGQCAVMAWLARSGDHATGVGSDNGGLGKGLTRRLA
jgi:hypothetical protein